MRLVKSMLIVILAIPFTALLIADILAVCSVGPNEMFGYRVGRLWARGILFLCGLKVRLSGEELLRRDKTYVFVANHSSMLDIVILFGYLPVPFRWLAKRELFNIPWFGAGLKNIGTIPVERKDPRVAAKSLRSAARRIREGVSVVIFPEGTRSRSGLVQDFKPGAFHLAVQSGQPVVPLAVVGAHKALPAGSLEVRKSDIRLIITPPIPTSGTHRNKSVLAREAHQRIEALQETHEFGKRT